MSETKKRKLVCGVCDKAFETECADEVANAEALLRFGVSHASDDPQMAVVCTGCYRDVLEWIAAQEVERRRAGEIAQRCSVCGHSSHEPDGCLALVGDDERWCMCQAGKPSRVEHVPNNVAIWQSDTARTYLCPICLYPVLSQYGAPDPPTITCLGFREGHRLEWT